jgi:dipeptidyl aminopeptidase/acylaminoacyl peptidase
MYQRQDFSFRSQGTPCAAWLYRPSGDGPHPVVVMAHGIGAVRQVRLPAYAERFAARGIAVLCFDYRAWGDSGGAPRYVVDIHAQHEDIHAALDVAQALPGIDGRRLALWGTSFGGGHTLAVAAERRDLRAVIVQCAVADARRYVAGRSQRSVMLRASHSLEARSTSRSSAEWVRARSCQRPMRRLDTAR